MTMIHGEAAPFKTLFQSHIFGAALPVIQQEGDSVHSRKQVQNGE